MPFEFEDLDIQGLVLVRPRIFRDDRGFFMETYKKSEFERAGIDAVFIQDNHSRSTKGVLRGLHYQLNPKAQGKLVRCTRGAIFDVAVDIRRGSPTFGRWLGVELTEENGHMLWVPAGFAHGFLVLTDVAEVIYKVSGAEYSPEHERTIRWNDKELSIDWPLGQEELILSEKDGAAPTLKEAEINFTFQND